MKMNICTRVSDELAVCIYIIKQIFWFAMDKMRKSSSNDSGVGRSVDDDAKRVAKNRHEYISSRCTVVRLLRLY